MIPPYEGRGRQRLLALHETKGVFSFRREYPLLIPQRKARGVPLDPQHCGLLARRTARAAQCKCGVRGCATSLLQNVTARNRAHSVARV